MARSQNAWSHLWRSPVLWGGLAAVGFYGLYQGDVLRGEFVRRYFAGHPVNYIETATFFVALAALVLKALDLLGQWTSLDRVQFPAALPAERSLAEVPAMRSALEAMSPSFRDNWLVVRLRSALEFVDRQGSTQSLDDELKFLSDAAAATAQASYGLVRIIIWAIPILGFLGTVIGITMAIAELSPEALEKSLPQVTAGLGVAFDTTALALALSMVLMFVQFLVDRGERELLARVDRRSVELLAARLPSPQAGLAGASEIEQLTAGVTGAVTQLVDRQAALWRSTIDAAHQQWARLSTHTREELEAALGRALLQHAECVGKSAAALATEQRQQMGEYQRALAQTVEALAAQQRELVRQGEVLGQVVEATGQVAQLEVALNRNLQALSGAGQFEDTLHSLAGAIHLLTARLDGARSPATVELARGRRGSQAA